MVESGFIQLSHAFLGEPDTGCYEIGVEIMTARGLRQIDQIAARGWFASRQMQMQHAHLCGLREDIDPFFGGQFVAGLFQVKRIGAIGAGEGTAMCEFGQHRHGWIDGGCFAHAFFSRKRRSARSCRNTEASVRITSFGAS